MIVLDTTTRTLEIVLAGAVSTNQLPFVATYQDSTVAPPATVDGVSNNTTAVTAVAAPASGAQRRLRYFSIYNADTGSATVTVQLNDNGTARAIVKMTLPAGTSLIFLHGVGWSVIPAPASGGGSGSNFFSTVTAKSANFTVAVADRQTLYQVTTGAGTITATLPAAATAAADWCIFLEKADNGAGTIATSPAITGPATALLPLLLQYDMVVVWTDGTNYYANGFLARVSSGGGSGGDVVQIFDSVLSVAAANFDITSIASTYKHLRLICTLRAANSADQAVSILLNNDSGTNYAYIRHYRDSGASDSWAQSVNDTKLYINDAPGSARTAGNCLGFELTLPDYAATTFRKTVLAGLMSSYTSLFVQYASNGMWLSTAAINRITISLAAGNIDVGSRATLYGMK